MLMKFVVKPLSYAVIVAVIVATQCNAEFGDYADPSFSCPATTTCRRVCVKVSSDCPSAMKCPSNLTLCADGSCAEECELQLTSPCQHACAPIACPKVIDSSDQCQASYGSYYVAEDSCASAEAVAPAPLTYTEPTFKFAYAWVSTVWVLIMLWCAFNQKLAPVQGSCQSLHVGVDKKAGRQSEASTVEWSQTGYKLHPIGMFMHYLTALTTAGFFVALFWLILQFYVATNNKPAALKLQIANSDEIIKAFIITWSVGFVWCFVLRWPPSLLALFLRRCQLAHATHVAVYTDGSNVESVQQDHLSNNIVFGSLRYVLNIGVGVVTAVLSSVFSSRFNRKENAVLHYVRVFRDKTDGSSYFMFHFRRYNYDSTAQAFVPGEWVVGESLGEIFSATNIRNGLSKAEVRARRRVVGKNTIEMERPSYLTVVVREFGKPFYIYQIFIIFALSNYWYYFMAMTYAFVAGTGSLVVAWFQYLNLRNLYRLTHISGQSNVLREGRLVSLDHEYLVPGDIVHLNPGAVYCDMALLSSEGLLVDESALTGESTPQGKIAMDANAFAFQYDRKEHSRHTISAGTCVLETEGSVAIVLKTGSHTAKGELLRDIFSFQRYKLKYDSEIGLVLFILVAVALIGFGITYHQVHIWFWAIYVVNGVISPLLPTVMTVSVGVSAVRLAQKRITCVNSQRIHVAGKVTHAFFDKTGTLTKQGLDFLSARTSARWNEHDSVIPEELAVPMATCHTLAKSHAGIAVGNPVDLAMFQASGATFSDKSTFATRVLLDRYGQELTILRSFDFDHYRMTQGVIVKLPNGLAVAFVKGSSENVRKICKSDSIPSGYNEYLREKARDGSYLISVAGKPVDLDCIRQMSRDEVERDLQFIGTLIFKNVMREEAREVIRQLAESDIKSIVVTGDNVITGIRIAQETGIMAAGKPVIIGGTGLFGEVVWSNEDGAPVGLPAMKELESGSVQLAVHASAFQELLTNYPRDARKLVKHIRVYGRCSPHDKVAVVDTFVHLGLKTLMCGDGGNDCGALKAAHVGVALSESEASVVSPFISLDKSITSVLEILKEGRCALASSLAVYKYLISYGQNIAFLEVITCFMSLTFSEWGWVFIEGVWPITMALTLPLAKPSSTLSPSRPTASLLGPHTLSSSIGIILLNMLFSWIALDTLWKQDWYKCRKWTFEDLLHFFVISDNYEAEVLFLVAGYQFVSTPMALNFGYEFRQGWFRNPVFVFFATVYSFIMFYITLVPGDLSCFFRVQCLNEYVHKGTASHFKNPVDNRFNTTVMPVDFRWKIVAIMAANTLALCFYEYVVVNGIRRRVAAQKRQQQQKGWKKFQSESPPSEFLSESAAPLSSHQNTMIPSLTVHFAENGFGNRSSHATKQPRSCTTMGSDVNSFEADVPSVELFPSGSFTTSSLGDYNKKKVPGTVRTSGSITSSNASYDGSEEVDLREVDALVKKIMRQNSTQSVASKPHRDHHWKEEVKDILAMAESPQKKTLAYDNV